MRSTYVKKILSSFSLIACVAGLTLTSAVIATAQRPASDSKSSANPAAVRSFTTPEQAADVLVTAAANFDVATLTQLFGDAGRNMVLTGDTAVDRQHATDFAAQANEQKKVAVDPKTGTRAFVLVGKEDWPFPVPLVKKDQKWSFDSHAGQQELMYRRIGANELDAIQICHGYVEAQIAYAYEPREGYDVNQYAQRIISTPGKQDGLAWQNADGTWAGPIGEKIAQAIDQGFTPKSEPYHGYFFKILKGQGPAAPLGEMNYVVNGVMIGGFGLVAAPAEYGVTGLSTFIVSQDGVVYQKDLGPRSLDEFKNMELFNPDNSWAPVSETD